jgi:hypothetical protein
MWPWIKRWHDWVMNNDHWPMPRQPAQPQALHLSYEKAGLVMHDPLIPWNAEAVLIEATLRLQPGARSKADFTLLLPGAEPIAAESLRPSPTGERHHIRFRLAMPPTSTTAELRFRGNRLTQMAIPVQSSSDYLQSLRVHLPTVFVQLGSHQVACQTFVASQSRKLTASAVLMHANGSLAPLADLGIAVEFRQEAQSESVIVPIALTASQLMARQALVTASPPKLPKANGIWTVTWRVGDQTFATNRLKAISRRAFHSSLRLSDTRFVAVDEKQGARLCRQVPPLTSISRLGPCFMIGSSEAGMAGLVQLQVHATVPGSVQPPLLRDQELLITDGPTMFAPGTLDVSELVQASAFELRAGARLLGTVALSPVPLTQFTAEGGFRPPPDFMWTAAADEQLSERLARLMDQPRG